MSTVTEETEKYPRNIQKLFKPGLPPPHYPPADFPPEHRKNQIISPIAHHKSKIDEYLQNELPKLKQTTPIEKTPFQIQVENGRRKRLQKKLSFKKQMSDWSDPSLILKHEDEISKDPYKTVFIARLDYSLTEVDLSPHFTKYGPLDSIKIVRSTVTNKSRGYGFVVFEKDTDAQACIADLAPTGLKIAPQYRTILVDMERSRVVRNWLPRRLGGGLGGRHYTNPNLNLRGSSNASAAASGRKLNLPMNPYQEKRAPVPGQSFGANTHGPSTTASHSFSSATYSSQSAFSSNPAYQRPAPESSSAKPSRSASIREKYDKYAKYSGN